MHSGVISPAARRRVRGEAWGGARRVGSWALPTIRTSRGPRLTRTRRGAVVVQVAVLSTVLLGMAAMAIDIGAMYAAKTELQAAADSAALAAAGELLNSSAADPLAWARDIAKDYALRNAVANVHAGISDSDVEFGKAIFNAETGRYSFQPGGEPVDAVRVRVARTTESEGGPLQLGFANIFGVSSKNMWARASAVLLPRDIAVVIDLSGSMNDDSELKHYKAFYGDQGDLRDGIQVNLRDIWCALDGPAPSRPYVPGSESESEYADDTGPSVGNMTVWGSEVVPETYAPASDAGLTYIRKSKLLTNPAINAYLTSQGYTSDEISKIMGYTSDGNSNHWRNRCGVMLGLASWKSGRPGGKPGGNGDGILDNSETTWISYPSYRGTWTWQNFIDYVQGSSGMTQTQPALQYRYGLKTFTNFLLENQAKNSQTNILWQTPEQPLQAVKDAVQTMTDVIVSLESLDRLSLETFATTVHHEVDLTDDLQSVPERLYQRQAGHYDTTTNIGGGLAQGVAELSSSRGRASAMKIIVLMTDGKPNINENGDYVGEDDPAVREYCLAKAQVAADAGIRIYCVSVGQDVDRELMQEIAAIGRGQEFYAAGTPEQYQAELEDIFRALGGKRPVALIE